MRVGKQALLENIDTALSKYEADLAKWREAVDWWKSRQESVWKATKQEQWRGLRDMITKALKADVPITADMVGEHLKSSRGYRADYWSDHVFKPDAHPSSPIQRGGTAIYAPNNVHVADLKALKNFLESSMEEEFSLTSLQRLGFKAPAFVFRAAVNG